MDSGLSMDIRSPIEAKIKKGNQLYFSRDSDCLQPLMRLIEQQKHRTLVMWALECAQEPLALLKTKYPDEQRPRKALQLCEAWARGDIKMPEAKRAILDVHAFAKEIHDPEFIALIHAVGHAGATVHTESHALGLPIYELTAIVHRVGLDQCELAVNRKLDYYYDRLLFWQENINAISVNWAKFLLDDSRPNKEKLLNEKKAKLLATVDIESHQK